MKYVTIILFIISVFTTSFKSKENTKTKAQEPKVVNANIDIDASASIVWYIITNKDYAKVLGNIFVKNGFIQSDWKLNSKVHFIYKPDYIVYSGIITKLKEEELIQVDYNINGLEYVEKFSIEKDDAVSKLSVSVSPYGDDFNNQNAMWQKWLSKVKELCEKQ